MRKAVIRDRATHDLVISSLGKGPQVFGKVLCKRKRYDITKKIILLMKTWRLCAPEGFSVTELLLSMLTVTQAHVAHKIMLCGLLFLLLSLSKIQEWAIGDTHSLGSCG